MLRRSYYAPSLTRREPGETDRDARNRRRAAYQKIRNAGFDLREFWFIDGSTRQQDEAHAQCLALCGTISAVTGVPLSPVLGTSL